MVLVGNKTNSSIMQYYKNHDLTKKYLLYYFNKKSIVIPVDLY